MNAATSSKEISFAVPETNCKKLAVRPGIHGYVSHRKRVASMTVWIASELPSMHKAKEAKAAGSPQHPVIKGARLTRPHGE